MKYYFKYYLKCSSVRLITKMRMLCPRERTKCQPGITDYKKKLYYGYHGENCSKNINNYFFICACLVIFFGFLKSDWLQQRAAFYDILTVVQKCYLRFKLECRNVGWWIHFNNNFLKFLIQTLTKTRTPIIGVNTGHEDTNH